MGAASALAGLAGKQLPNLCRPVGKSGRQLLWQWRETDIVTERAETSQAPGARAAASSSFELKAVAAALIGSTLVGSVPMFATGLYKGGMDAASVLFWRYWIAMLFLAPLALWTSPSVRDDWQRAGRALFLNAITLGAVQTYTYFKAVETLPTSIVVTIFFTYPILTLAFDRFVFRLPVGLGSLLAVGLVFFGAMLTGWPSLSFASADPIGIACAIATPIVFSAYIAVSYRFTRQTSPIMGAACIYGGLACTYAAVALLFGLKWPPDLQGWAAMFWIGTFGGLIQISAFAYALPRLSSSGYSIVISVELVTVVLLGVLVLGEHLSLIQMAGVTLVVLGIITDRILRARRAA